MSHRNDHYNAVRRMYDLRQLNNQREYDLRKQEVYRCVPELEALDRQLVSNSIAKIKNSLLSGKTNSGKPVSIQTQGNATDAEDAGGLNTSALSEHEQKRRKLLTEAGFPEDYLEPKYLCPHCKDTGYIDDKMCKCFKAAAINLLYADSGLRCALDSENFDTFSYEYYADDITDPLTGLTPYQNIQNAVKTAWEFIRNFDVPDSPCRNLLICGNTGVGKTFLTNCIARELIHSNHGVVYLSANELLSVLEDYKFKRNTASADTEAINERYAAIHDCDLLIIDDLGTEMTNNFSVTQLFNLLNSRQLQRRSTIISTNLSMQHIKETYSERIFSRIASSYDYIRLFGEDIRLKKL